MAYAEKRWSNEDVRRGLRERLGRSGLSALRELGRVAESRGVHACLVGGIVRDLLLGRACRDVDVVVEDDAKEFADAVISTLGGTVRPNPRFGTALVRLVNGFEFELAGARSESYDHPAALPRVAPGSLRDDLVADALMAEVERVREYAADRYPGYVAAHPTFLDTSGLAASAPRRAVAEAIVGMLP